MTTSPLLKSLSRQGQILFRWRSYIPLLLLVPGLLALRESAALSLDNETVSDLYVALGFAVSILGLSIRWITHGYVPAGTSGRNTHSQRAHHLNTDGAYSIVRNPLYLGNFLAILGVLISTQVWWHAALGSLSYWLYIERIIAAEEAFLVEKYNREYLLWAEKTPAFFPNLKLWRKPNMPFSLRTVLRREYNGLMAVCCAFLLTEVIKDILFEHVSLYVWANEDWPWLVIFITGASLFMLLRSLKKHTRILHVEGR